MINIFKKGHKTLNTDIETWVVKWTKASCSSWSVRADMEESAQFFASKEEAEEYVESLRKAIKLLGYKGYQLTTVTVKKVENKGVN